MPRLYSRSRGIQKVKTTRRHLCVFCSLQKKLPVLISPFLRILLFYLLRPSNMPVKRNKSPFHFWKEILVYECAVYKAHDGTESRYFPWESEIWDCKERLSKQTLSEASEHWGSLKLLSGISGWQPAGLGSLLPDSCCSLQTTRLLKVGRVKFIIKVNCRYFQISSGFFFNPSKRDSRIQ